MTDERFEAGTPLSDADIVEIERIINRKLPVNYRIFLSKYGGAFVGGAIDGSENLSILHFFGKDGAKSLSIQLSLHPDLRDVGILPIAGCEVGNIYVLETDNSIRYIDYYSGVVRVHAVSSSFEDFIDRIVILDD